MLVDIVTWATSRVQISGEEYSLVKFELLPGHQICRCRSVRDVKVLPLQFWKLAYLLRFRSSSLR